MAARVNGAIKTSCVLYFRPSLSLLRLQMNGRECVCYYFVDIQAECAGTWLVMAGYVCNVCVQMQPQQAPRSGEGRRGGEHSGNDSWILICQPQAAVRQTVDGGQSTHDDDSPDKSGVT